MNAYELADWLEKWTEGKPYPTQNPLIIAMLRQQQAQIEALKAHSVKELTDEEIKQVINSLICTADKNWNVEFARAILRKAKK